MCQLVLVVSVLHDCEIVTHLQKMCVPLNFAKEREEGWQWCAVTLVISGATVIV